MSLQNQNDPSPSLNNALSVFGGGWIFDCGATDTMSYNPKDFLTHVKPMKNIIKTVNGEGIKVEGAGTIYNFEKLFVNY